MQIEKVKKKSIRADYDGAWKEILEKYFQAMLELCLPGIAAQIDWTRHYESLDQELQAILPRSKTGKHIVDKLIKVWQLSGEEIWVLIHVELQTQKDLLLPLRLFTSHYRIFDRQQRPIVSLAVLSDLETEWRPVQYAHEQWGTKLQFDFVSVKLLDYERPIAEWKEVTNPILILIQAHLLALRTRKKLGERLQSKIALARFIRKTLREQGLDQGIIDDLLYFVDWLMALPEPYMLEYGRELEQLKEDSKMAFVSTLERIAEKRGYQHGIEAGFEKGTQTGIGKGIEAGELKMLRLQLELRFGALSADYENKLSQANEAQLLEWCKRLIYAKAITDVFQN